MESEIKRIRKKLGLSQLKFADELKTYGVVVQSTAIGNYEAGIRIPRPAIALAIVQFAATKDIQTSMDKIYRPSS